ADLGAARLPFAQSALVAAAQRTRPARPARFSGRGDGAAGLRSRLAVAGCTRGRRRRDRARAARPLRARTQPQRGGLQRRGVHQALRPPPPPPREKTPRLFRPPRPARRQAPISAPPAAGVGLFAALAQPPGAGGAQRVVYCPRAGVEYDLIQRALGMAILPAEFAQAPICS